MPDYNPPIQPKEISLDIFTHHISGQDYIIKSSPQCPVHLYALEATRGSRPNTLLIAACTACIQEKKVKNG